MINYKKYQFYLYYKLIMFQLITLGNAIILYDYYNYYIVVHSICTGCFIIYKAYKKSSTFYKSILNKTLTYNNKIKEVDDWVIIE